MADAIKKQPGFTTYLDCAIKVIDLLMKIVVLIHTLQHV